MINQIANFGISSFGYAFGEKQDVKETASQYTPNPENVLQWGCHTYYRVATDVFAIDLATAASKEALDRANIDISKVDLVVLATSEMPEYLYWDSSAALARALGANKVQTMLLNNEGCGAGIKVFGYIAGVLAIQPEVQTVLLAIVNRVSEYHRNRMNINNCVHSDGAVAAVLQRGYPHNQWLSTSYFTCPEFCDFSRGDYGGARVPTPPEGWSSNSESGY